MEEGMETINIHAAKTNLSKLIERAIKGEDIVISRNGEPLVHLTPYKKEQAPPPRRFGGQWTGKIWYAPDYDQADAEIQKMFEDSEIFPKN
jgi:prevent-host-death family protein